MTSHFEWGPMASDFLDDKTIVPIRSLVISLCDGIGCAWLAVKEFDSWLDVTQWSAENVRPLREFTASKHSIQRQFNSNQECTWQVIEEQLNAERYELLFLTIGAPCTPFTGLGLQQGFSDPDSEALTHFAALKAECEEKCAQRNDGIQFRYLLEEVSSMSDEHRDAITKLMGGDIPTAMWASDFQWVERARLFWGLHHFLPDLHGVLPWGEIYAPGELLPAVWVVRWTLGPVPASMPLQDKGRPQVWLHHALAPTVAPRVGTLAWSPQTVGCFSTFVRAFHHPADKGTAEDKCDAELLAAFNAHERAYPLYHYRKGNLLYYESDLHDPAPVGKPPSDAQRELLMGLPEGYTETLPSFYKDKRVAKHARGAAVGNAWHLPQVLCAFFCILASMTGVKGAYVTAPTLSDPGLLPPSLAFGTVDQLRAAGFLDTQAWLHEALCLLQPWEVPQAAMPKVDEEMLYVLRIYEFTMAAQAKPFVPGLDLSILMANEDSCEG